MSMKREMRPYAHYQARHVLWQVEDGVATVLLNRPEKKNLLTLWRR